MIGNDAFCPETGAPLSRERHYDDRGAPQRAVLAREESAAESTAGDSAEGRAGELTNGATRSSKAALFNYFRRCHERHADTDDALYRKAALGLGRLKRAADGRDGEDVYVWYALGRRLDAAGFAVEWMHTHAEPRCPECHGRLAYESGGGDVRARCGTNCTGDHADQLHEIRTIVAELYARAFDEAADPDEFLRFER